MTIFRELLCFAGLHKKIPIKIPKEYFCNEMGMLCLECRKKWKYNYIRFRWELIK